MSGPARVAVRVLWALFGAVAGASAAWIIGEALSGAPVRPATTATVRAGPGPAPIERRAIRRRDHVLLAWAPGGLPTGSAQALKRVRGVRAVTIVRAGLEWLDASRTVAGSPVDKPPAGYAIPFEVAFVHPGGYAPFAPATERDAILALDPKHALLAATEARLRGTSDPLKLSLRDRRVETVGVVSNAATNGYEALMAGQLPRFWPQVDRYALIRTRSKAVRPRVEKVITRLVGSTAWQIRARGETPYLRYGDAVQPQMILKKNFGEFSARPTYGGYIRVDPAWERRHIVTGRVPLLGEVTCNRALIPQLRGALHEVASSGLKYAIDPTQYRGCLSTRFVDSRPGGRLSHHSWGIALDINALDNPHGSQPSQDERLVQIMRDWGFTWGGRWLDPDGMHFEWYRWP